MTPQPTSATQALSILLQRWVEVAFTGQERDIVMLNGIWQQLADALCGHVANEPPGPRVAKFFREIADLRPTSRAGDPPTKALEERIHELIAAGLREFFIVVAVRQAMGQLITTYFPAQLDSWQKLADEIIPMQLQFAMAANETPNSSGSFGPTI